MLNKLLHIGLAIGASILLALFTWSRFGDPPRQSDHGPADLVVAVRRALDNGQFLDAERLATEHVAGTKSEHGSTSSESAAAQDLLVEARLGNGRGGEPANLELAESVVALRSTLARDDRGLATSLANLGTVRTERGEFSAALPLHERALTIRRSLKPVDTSIADSLEDLALALTYLERFTEATAKLDEARPIREAGRATAPLEMARHLYLTGLLRSQAGEYATAMPPTDEALTLWARAAPDHPDAIATRQLKGYLLFLTGDWRAAEATWSEALTQAEKVLREDHPMFATLERWLANAHVALGRLTEGRARLQRAMVIAQRTFAPCHPELPSVFGDMANTLTYEGEYIEAQKLYAQSEATLEQCLGPVHSLTATAVYNEGELAIQMGDLKAAERLHERAVAAWSKGLGHQHPYVAIAMDALARAVELQGDLARARELYARTLALRRSALGVDHPDVAWTLTNVARMAGRSDDARGALRAVDQAVDIYRGGRAAADPDHLARALALRGSLYAQLGDYASARVSFTDALAVRQDIFGAAHPLTAESEVDLASAEFAVGSPGAALDRALGAERVGRDHLRFTIRYLPERHAMAYSAKRPRGLDLALSIVAAGRTTEVPQTLDAIVQSRGVVLDELAARATSSVGRDPALAPLQSVVATARQRFATLMLRSLQGVSAVPQPLLEEARQQKEAAERALAERSVDARNEVAMARSGLDEIRAALPKDTAVVSYLRYERTLFGGRATRAQLTPSYIAFVIRPAPSPLAAIPLGTAASLEATITAWRREAEGGALRTRAGVQAERTYRAVGEQLRRQVWDPLTGHLDGMSHVMIVPDGALNLVSFGALPIDDRQYLVERGPVVHLLSTERDLLRPPTTASGGLLAVGGPSYDVQSALTSTPATRAGGCDALGRLRFEDLPGARAEVEDIASIWSRAMRRAPATATSGIEVTVLSGDAASKEAVLRRAAGRRIVHFATHGFFLGANCNPAAPNTRSVGGLVTVALPPSVVEESPLLLAGLAFAGSNGRTSTAPAQEEGILTAEEVAGLNLQGTEWAVLSACDTGLGEIHSGEGVFGLRRAFQIAGVRTVVMSLWSVEDESTRSWMRALYEARLERRLSTADAVQDASRRMLASLRARGKGTHPFYWAAFVAAGEWR